MQPRVLLLALALLPGLSRAQTSEDLAPTVDVHPADLTRLIDSADRLVVKAAPAFDGSEAKVVFESTDRRDLDTLKVALTVRAPDECGCCFCIGNPTVTLYAADQQLEQVAIYGAMAVNCGLWSCDAEVVDVEALLTWFDERKITSPREEYESMLAQQEQDAAAWTKWVMAMPEALVPSWNAVDPSGAMDSPDLEPFRKALATQFEYEPERIQALFAWYGSGAGPWSGFPAYEDIAERLLLDYPTSDLVAALEQRELTLEQVEGAARLFGGWTFSRERPADLDRLPLRLKARLLEHVRTTSDDEDKRDRADAAFDGC